MSSKIIEDLTHIPNIIAGLGLSIAEAQRHFDLDYLQSVERLLATAQDGLGLLQIIGQARRLCRLDASGCIQLDHARG